MNEQVYDWDRFWHPVGTATVLSNDGFVLDPTTAWGTARNPSLVRFGSFSHLPCLALLGEPGIGKSRTLETEWATVEAQARTDGDEALYVDLRSVGSDTHLFRKVFDNPKFRAWAESGGTTRLHLFLDSVDECLLRVTTLAQILLDEFPQYPTERLSLRIACRTAVWTGSLRFLEEGLRKIWGKDALGIAELSPLRRVDVLHAAERNGITDPEAFIENVKRAGAEAFAIKPVTLNLLLRIYKEQTSLPDSQVEIYRQGCRLLCAETNESRQASGATGNLSVDQRLALAGRIAAVTVFANRYAVFTQQEHWEMTDADVAISSIIGGVEKDTIGGAFLVNESALKEVLNTGLFTGRGTGRMGWAHQTYSEYLAAWYTADLHSISGTRLLSLLIHPGDPDRRIAPQLHAVAAWVAPWSGDVVRHIVQSDPDVLLAGDTATRLDPATKARAVGRLLEMVRENVLSVRNMPVADRLRQLNHPALPDQLLPILADPTAGVAVRHATVDIGEACARRELQEEWARIALDQTEPMLLRVQAAYAVARVGDAQTRRLMLPLAEGEAGDDPDDELKGCGLMAVWPDHIDGSQLFGCLSLHKSNLYGAYRMFLNSLDLERLSDADLPAALKWAAAQTTPYLSLDHRGHIVLAVIVLGWERMDAPGVLDALADAALARANEHEAIFGTDRDGRVTPPDMADDAKRRRLVEALVSRVARLPKGREEKNHSEERNNAVLRVCMQGRELFRVDDLPWLLDRLRTAPLASPLAKAYARLIHYLFHWCDNAPERLQAVSEARQWSPELAEEYRHLFDPVALDSDQARHMREQYAEEQSWEERRRRLLIHPTPHERVLKHLADFEGGDNSAWVSLCSDLQLEPDSQHYAYELEPDITVLPGWVAADATLRARIVDAAEAYLHREQPGDLAWIGTQNLPYRSAAGYRALSLLLVQNRDALLNLPVSARQSWAPVIPAFPLMNAGEGWERQRVLVAFAYLAAPGATIGTLMRLIDSDNEGGTTLYELEAFQACMDARLSAALLSKVEEPALSAAVTSTILDVLMVYGQGTVPESAQSVAERLLRSLLAEKESAVPGAAQKARLIAVVLATRASDAGWGVIWPAVQADEAFGREVFEKIAHEDFSGGRPLSVLNEGQLADLYLWLTERYPHAEDPVFEDVHFVGERESLAHWRDGLLSQLTARGTALACTALERLVASLPRLTGLPHLLRQARDATRRNTWEPPTPEQVIRMAVESDLRLVRSEAELLAAVVESLERLGAILQEETPAAFDVWSEIPGEEATAADGAVVTGTADPSLPGATKKRRRPTTKTYRPKSENAFSDYVVRHLRRDLKGRGIVLGREVEIRPGTDGGASGEVTDIHVDAVVPAPGGGNEPRDVVTVVVETKIAWNKELYTALEEQLVDRYLRASRCSHGIYLVGWFRCDQWDRRDYRKADHATGTVADLRARLKRQASDVSRQSAVSIVAVVLDASLR